MSTFLWILVSGLAMSALALVGSVTLLVEERTLRRILLPIVAFAAGSLLGGAFFHMLPAALEAMASLTAFAWLLLGFAIFLLLEQFLHWHRRSHGEAAAGREPLTYLVLVGDALHNFMGGLAVAGAFLVDVRLGVTTWLAAAAHEVPQELGDFGVLVHGGWPRGRALLLNFLSALTFLGGAIVAYVASFQVSVAFLLPLAAGNFLYIAASDLVPEVKGDHGMRDNLVHLAAFITGLAVLYALAVLL